VKALLAKKDHILATVGDILRGGMTQAFKDEMDRTIPVGEARVLHAAQDAFLEQGRLATEVKHAKAELSNVKIAMELKHSPEENLRQRLQLKMRTQYATHRDVLTEFLEWLSTEGAGPTATETGKQIAIDTFLESRS